MRYPSDDLTDAERARLAPHVTTSTARLRARQPAGDRQGRAVRPLLALPRHAAAAVPRRVRRLAAGAPRRVRTARRASARPSSTSASSSATGTTRWPSSAAPTSPASGRSNILTKILQRPRLARLPRAVDALHRLRRADARRRLPLLPRPRARAGVRGGDGRLFAPTRTRSRSCAPGSTRRSRAPTASPRRPARASTPRRYDLLRGLLPAASLSHMGIYATGQAYEQLILHLIGHPLPEARRYGQLILDAIKAVMPSFVARVERPTAAASGSPTSSAARRRRALGRAARARPRDEPRTDRPSVRCCTSTATRTRCSPRCCSRPPPGQRERRAAVARLSPSERAAAARELVGERATAATAPAAASRPLRYRFEIVSDYGAFRDLQRHRMLTVQWQALTPDLGAGVPEEVVAAGAGDAYAPRPRALPRRVRAPAAPASAPPPYALCLGYRIRYVLDLNAREAMQLIELRSGREGHPDLPRRRARDAPPDRRRPPRRRARDDLRRHRDRAAARAHPQRDAHRGAPARPGEPPPPAEREGPPANPANPPEDMPRFSDPSRAGDA